MFAKITSRRGETLIEVLVAIVILILGVVGALGLLGISSNNNQLARERVIAANLAREGIEAVRNVRDTNWLRFAGERRKCWNNIEVGVCDGSTSIQADEAYIAELDLVDYRWTLDQVGQRLDLSTTGNDDFRLWVDSDDGIYEHAHDANDEPSVFFREIFIEYVDDDGNNAAAAARAGSSCASVETCGNAMRVTSRVEWQNRGQIRSAVLTTILTDYLGRKNHE